MPSAAEGYDRERAWSSIATYRSEQPEAIRLLAVTDQDRLRCDKYRGSAATVRERALRSLPHARGSDVL
jgi:hypothetical protein